MAMPSPGILSRLVQIFSTSTKASCTPLYYIWSKRVPSLPNGALLRVTARRDSIG
jgi:hypothetical protein